MKSRIKFRIAILTVLFTGFVFTGKAQCDVPTYIPSFGHEFRINDMSDVDTYTKTEQVLNTPNYVSKYYSPKCGVNPIKFRYSTANNASRKLQMYVELWKQKFDCSGNLVGAKTYVLSTSAVEYSGNTEAIHLYFDINVEENTYYQIKAQRRLKTLGIYGSYNFEWSNNLRFIAPTSYPSPAGNFVDVLSVDSRSGYSGWVVDVHQLDAKGVLDFDASPTSCETNWRYSISEFNLATWASTNTVSSGVINGQAGTIDLDGFYTPGLVKGKVYIVTVVAGSGWYPEYFWFEIKDAGICGSLTNNGYIHEFVPVIGGNVAVYTLYKRCRFNAMKLNTSCTESVDEYKISVQPVNASYVATGALQTTNWVSGPVASEYNLNAMFGAFALGQRYEVTYQVRNSLKTKKFYYRFEECTIDGEGDDPDFRTKSGVEIEEEMELDVNIYPNPSSGNFFVKIGNTDDVVTVEVVDLTGRVVVGQQNVFNGELNIDLNNHKNGIYLVRIIQNNEVTIKKIVKQ